MPPYSSPQPASSSASDLLARIAVWRNGRRRLTNGQILIESSCTHAYVSDNMAVPSVAAGIKGRPFSYLSRMLPPYTKPHLSFADQLALLMARGLGVTDQAKAVLHLERIGYGRLTPYWQPLQQLVPDPNDATRAIRSEQFQGGAEFRHAVDLYLFDKQLRLLFLDAVERVEVALRVDIAHALGKRDPFAHRSTTFLDAHRANQAQPSGGSRHQNWLANADRAVARSKEDWVKEFYATYSPPIPIWMAVEAWDFGTLSWLLEIAHPNDRAAIAKRYGLLPNTLVSWIKTLAFVRNTSAHHSRLWNAAIVNQPLVPKPYEAAPLVHLGSDLERRTRVYGAATVANYFVRRINVGSSWPARMKAHWHAFPAMPFAGPVQGGFLPGWDAEAIWI